jgi:trimeric autotransporter adhesin
MVVKKMHANTFTIRTSRGGVEVSWMVTGIRRDAFANAHRVPVEEYKKDDQRGLYLYPTEAGHPKERGIDQQRMERRSGRLQAAGS